MKIFKNIFPKINEINENLKVCLKKMKYLKKSMKINENLKGNLTRISRFSLVFINFLKVHLKIFIDFIGFLKLFLKLIEKDLDLASLDLNHNLYLI